MIDKIVRLLSLGFFVFACYLIKKEVTLVGVDTLLHSFYSVSGWVLLLGVVITFLNYITLSFYDVLGLLYLKKKLSYPFIFKLASLSFALSNLTGHIYSSGGAIHFLLLRNIKFKKEDIFQLLLFITMSILFGLGWCFLISLYIENRLNILTNKHIIHIFYSIGFAIVVFFLWYFRLLHHKKKEIKIKKITIKMPTLFLSLCQMIVGILDFFTLFLVFYCFLRYFIDIPFLECFIIFCFANILSYISQVPAGIGVLESCFLLLYPHSNNEKGMILAAFLLFRCVYFILPFILSCGWFLSKKIKRKLF